MQDKIPSSVIKFIDDNRNKDYKINIDYSKNINEQPIKKDTRILLSIIYRDYLCGDEERERHADRRPSLRPFLPGVALLSQTAGHVRRRDLYVSHPGAEKGHH